MLNAEGRCDSAVMARMTCALKVSRILICFNWEEISVRMTMLSKYKLLKLACSSESWPVKVEHEVKQRFMKAEKCKLACLIHTSQLGD